MTFKEYKKLYGPDGYCSLLELESIREESNPRSFKCIERHWMENRFNQMSWLEQEMTNA